MELRNCSTCMFGSASRAIQMLRCVGCGDGYMFWSKAVPVEALKARIDKPFVFSKAAPPAVVNLIRALGITPFTRTCVERTFECRIPVTVTTLEELDKHFIENPPIMHLAAIEFAVRPGCFNHINWFGFPASADAPRAQARPTPPPQQTPRLAQTAPAGPSFIYRGSANFRVRVDGAEIWGWGRNFTTADFEELVRLEGETDFDPDAPLTAEQLNDLLFRYMEDDFRDNGTGSEYADYDDRDLDGDVDYLGSAEDIRPRSFRTSEIPLVAQYLNTFNEWRRTRGQQ